MRVAGAILVAALVSAAAAGAAAPAAPQPLMVYAAADLALALRDLAPLFEKAAGARITLVLGSTGNLAKQIEHGAPADVFFAADEGFVDGLRDKGVVIAASRTLYAQGRLALVTSVKTGIVLKGLDDLARPNIRRIAIANPAHAPYGRAAQQALESAGLWDRLRPRLVYGENIRHTLQFVESGAVEAGIVAVSIAKAPGIRAVPIDPALYRPLKQIAVVIKRSARPELGLAFIHFLNGPEGRPIMKRYGFLLPGEF